MIERFERFSLAIFEISHCWHKLAAEEMTHYGLKGPHAIYLLTLYRVQENLTAAQLCELCGRDKADVSRAVALMEEKGLILRQGSSYRAKLVLTDTGRQAAEHVCTRATAAVECAGEGISEENRAIFYACLESIAQNLQILTQKGIPGREKTGESYGCKNHC